MIRLHTLFAALVAVFVLSCSGGDNARPNVILITLDTVRADYVSCYGVHPGLTPSLDALAAEGTRFDMAVSTAGVTPVSHASILTGLNNQTHKLRVLSAPSGYKLPDDVPMLSTVFAKEGYRTVAVHSAFPVSRNFGFQRGFEVFEDMNTQMQTAPGGNKTQWDTRTQRRSDDTTDVVQRVLGDKQPYFLWIHYWDPHDWNLTPDEEYMPPKEVLFDEQGQIRRPAKELYAAEIKFQDAQIGRLMQHLRSKGLLDNTIVVVTADHGQGLMDHGWAAHRLVYQEQIHVPLIVRAPGVKPTPVVKDLVRTIDIFPTILDFAGVKAPKGVDGRSLRALMEGKSDEKRLAFADQINGYDWNAGMKDREERKYDQFLYMAFDWPWKLTYRPLHPDHSELYNVAEDRAEAHNVYAVDHEHAIRLRRELAKARPWVPGPYAGKGQTPDPAQARALAELGYTEGETVDPTWKWVCPEDTVTDLGDMTARCPKCKTPPLMIRH